MVDSGASVNVAPRWFAPTANMEQGRRLTLKTATGEPVNKEGEGVVQVRPKTGGNALIKFDVYDKVKQPILSVQKLNESGNTVTFAPNGA